MKESLCYPSNIMLLINSFFFLQDVLQRFKSTSYQRGFKVKTHCGFWGDTAAYVWRELTHCMVLVFVTGPRQKPCLLHVACQWVAQKNLLNKDQAVISLYPVAKALLSDNNCHRNRSCMIDDSTRPLFHCPSLFIALRVYWWAAVWYANIFGTACSGLSCRGYCGDGVTR